MTDADGLFYSGLVARAYGPLRGSRSDPAMYERFVRTWGEPALELGCGHGEPILDLCAAGLDVTGLDISPDMIERARADVLSRGLDVQFVCAPMQDFDLGRTFRSIYIAGATIQLILDGDDVRGALQMIARHLDPDGRAVVPIFVPEPVPSDQLGQWREHVDDDGSVLAVAVIADEYLVDERLHHQALRYERRVDGEVVESAERVFSLRWYAPGEFADLAADAGLAVTQVFAASGGEGPLATGGGFVLGVAHP